MQWQPNPDSVKQLADIVTISSRGENNILKDSYDQLEVLKQNPEFLQYLSFIFAYGDQANLGESTRLVCGYYLKTTLKSLFVVQKPETKIYIKSCILNCLISNSPAIRNAAGTVVSVLLTIITLDTWPELLQGLYEMIKSQDETILTSCMNCFSQITEDCALQLDSDLVGRPLNTLVPQFLLFFQHPNEQIRLLAVKCMRNIIDIEPQALTMNLSLYLSGLSALANDSSVSIRSLVCNSLTALTDIYISQLYPSMNDICNFMLTAIQDSETFVAIQATEFWTTIIDIKEDSILRSIYNYLQQLIPILVHNMRYNEEEIADLESDSIFMVGDSVTPYIYKGEKEDEIMNNSGEWTLRKASGSCLEQVATTYTNNILQFILKPIESCLSSPSWYIVESGILCLGAISEGCQEDLTQELNTIMPALLQSLLNPPNSSLFGTVSWCIGRYSNFVFSRGEDAYLPSIVDCLLKAMKHNNSKIQHTSTSCLSVLIENDEWLYMNKYFDAIFSTICDCFTLYNEKNTRMLLEALGALAEHMPERLSRGNCPSIILPILITRWTSLNDLDDGMLSLLECMIYVILALGDTMSAYIPDIYRRCIKIIDSVFVQYASDDIEDKCDKMYISCAMDLIGSMVDTVKGGLYTVVNESNLLNTIVLGMKDSNAEVRQSSIALLGDLALYLYTYIEPVVPELLTLCAKNIDLDYPRVCNNSIWSIGEITMKEMANINQLDELPDNIRDNCAVTFGRLCLAIPQEMSQFIGENYGELCTAISTLLDGREKDEASRGVCMIIQYNEEYVRTYFEKICTIICSWNDTMNPELLSMFQQILLGFKQLQGTNWELYKKHMNRNILYVLKARYDFE
ncbi:hypothetical protein WA158_007852 [Blastocystis sp. Blastoise]